MSSFDETILVDGKQITVSQIKRDCILLSEDAFFDKYDSAMDKNKDLKRVIFKELRAKEILLETIVKLPNSKNILYCAANELSEQLRNQIPCKKVSFWLVEYKSEGNIVKKYLVPYAWTGQENRPEFELHKDLVGKMGCLVLRDIVYNELYNTERKLSIEDHIVNDWRCDERVDHSREVEEFDKMGEENENGMVVIASKEKNGQKGIIQMLNKYKKLETGLEKGVDFTPEDYLVGLEYADIFTMSYL